MVVRDQKNAAIVKPSEALEHGICPFCLGDGEIESLIYGMHACPLCKGTKKWPPPDDPSWNDEKED
jgi:hypothetical protein